MAVWFQKHFPKMKLHFLMHDGLEEWRLKKYKSTSHENKVMAYHFDKPGVNDHFSFA